MSNYEYQVRISKLSARDGGGFIALVPELPGCMSDGETYEEAIQNVKGAIDDWIKTASFRGQAIPEPEQYTDDEDYSGRLVIRIPKKLHRELSKNAVEQCISLNQLILYFLSKQAGIEENKSEMKAKGELKTKDSLINKDNGNNSDKGFRNFNLTLVNIPSKGWSPLTFIPQNIISSQIKGDE